MARTGEAEFSIAVFFDDGTHIYAGRYMLGERAVRSAKLITDAAGDNVTKVIITDGGDNTVFQWERGKGVTWPVPTGRGDYAYPES